jgi:small subunit ribosomal protein S13
MYSFRNQDLSELREIRSALCEIFGIGFRKALLIITKVGLSYPFFMSNLTNYYFNLMLFLLHAWLLSVNRIKRTVSLNVKTLVDTGSRRGRRHVLKLPTRGQRSRTNANTIKRTGGK